MLQKVVWYTKALWEDKVSEWDLQPAHVKPSSNISYWSRRACVADEAKLAIVFTYFFFFFFLLRLLIFTHFEETFFCEKNLFSRVFSAFYDQHSVVEYSPSKVQSMRVGSDCFARGIFGHIFTWNVLLLVSKAIWLLHMTQVTTEYWIVTLPDINIKTKYCKISFPRKILYFCHLHGHCTRQATILFKHKCK